MIDQIVEYEERSQSNDSGGGREIMTIKFTGSQFSLQVQRTE